MDNKSGHAMMSESELNLRRHKAEKIKEIECYDSSNAINVCYIIKQGNTISYWANKSERSALKSAIKDAIAMGRHVYRLDLRNIGISVEIECERLLSMLSELEVYAIDCYNKTSDHIFAIRQLNTIDEIENYNYQVGYPDKLTFIL